VPRTGLLHDPYTSARGVLKVFAPLRGLRLFCLSAFASKLAYRQAALHAPKQKSLPRYGREDFVHITSQSSNFLTNSIQRLLDRD